MINVYIREDIRKVLKVLGIIKKKDNKDFIFLKRPLDKEKDPHNFMNKLGINVDDAIEIIKNLSIEDFKEIIPDTKNDYMFLYVFNTMIKTSRGYIKIGFRYNDLTGKVFVVSFHESNID